MCLKKISGGVKNGILEHIGFECEKSKTNL